MINDKLRSLLFDWERENNIRISGSAKPHIFGRAFHKHALAICRGERESFDAAPARLRCLPLWAAVLIFLLCAAMLISCAAAAVCNFFGTASMSTGFLESGTDIVLHGTTESFNIGMAEIVSIIHVKESRKVEKVEFLVKASSVMSEKNVFDFYLKYGDEKMPVYIMNRWNYEGATYYSVIACAELINEEITFLKYGEEVSVKLENISDNGYEVLSDWPTIDGVEIKMLPVYGDNRLFYVANDIDGTNVKVTDFTVYDEDGKSSRGRFPQTEKYYTSKDSFGDIMKKSILSGESDQYNICDVPLSKDISKIEINSVNITMNYNGEEFLIDVPEDGCEALVGAVWIEHSGYSEEIVSIKREGKYARIKIRRIIDENSLVTDFKVIYNNYNNNYCVYNDDGNTYELKFYVEKQDPVITLSAKRIIYTLESDETPLGVISLNNR